ncbi:MAG TPA: DUF305 domain-containing protein [Pseudonocardia sp.]
MPITSHLPTRCTALLTAAAAAVTLTGCAGSTSTPGTPSAAPASAPVAAPNTAVSAAHNQADVSFVQQMIPHHQQAVAMAKLAATRAASPRVKDLAGRIEAAQQPEIDQMTGFLRIWNIPAAPDPDASMSAPPTMTDMPEMSRMNHSQDSSGQGAMGSMPGMSMPGMMSDAAMRQLGQTSGPAFDTRFLQMMIGHHQGAVSMSQTELADGQNPDATALARNIITAQQREITEMGTLLGG